MKSINMLLIACMFLAISCNAQKSKSGKTISYKTPNQEMQQQKLPIDAKKSEAAKAIIRAVLIHKGTGDKYIWDTVQVIAVLKNDLNFKFPEKLAVARYSWDEGFKCPGEFVLYLNPYPLGAQELNEDNAWMRLGGKSEEATACLE
ncbi:MAG: hypothetical protein JST36_04275 [Bacteroidetes bacterium]|nr:hypothetical protein [Bacteroidota bacterium]